MEDDQRGDGEREPVVDEETQGHDGGAQPVDDGGDTAFDFGAPVDEDPDGGDPDTTRDADDTTSEPDTTRDADDTTSDPAASPTTDSTAVDTDRGKSKVELDSELEEMTTGDETDEQARSGETDHVEVESVEAVEGSTGPGSGDASGDEDDGDDLDPTVAGVLSFLVPGLGNLYNGQSGRGLVWLVVWTGWLLVGWGFGGFVFGLVLGLATYGLMFLLTGFVLVVVEFVVHVVAAYDAYNQAEKINDGTATA